MTRHSVVVLEVEEEEEDVESLEEDVRTEEEEVEETEDGAFLSLHSLSLDGPWLDPSFLFWSLQESVTLSSPSVWIGVWGDQTQRVSGPPSSKESKGFFLSVEPLPHSVVDVDGIGSWMKHVPCHNS